MVDMHLESNLLHKVLRDGVGTACISPIADEILEICV